METPEKDAKYMARAVQLAKLSEGYVEPNPLVGCVIVKDDKIVGEGFHKKFGGPHAEVFALESAGEQANDSTCYVTLEPCCHTNKKTPPCVPLLINAGIRRVVIGIRDPNPEVSGKGIDQLRKAKIFVETGILERRVNDLNAPYLTVIQQNRPWIHAKWAMTLDGKMASRTGSSQWISSDESLALAHRLRGKMDAVIVGSRTALMDDPMLTPRLDVVLRGENPAGTIDMDLPDSLKPKQIPLPDDAPFWRTAKEFQRTPLRIVMDSSASLPSFLNLVQTAHETPLLVAVGQSASQMNIQRLQEAGSEVLVLPGRIVRELSQGDKRTVPFGVRSRNVDSPVERRRAAKSGVSAEEVYRKRMDFLLSKLVERGVTNVMIEGGTQLLGFMFDAKLIDEVHAFIAPKLIGGDHSSTPIGGAGLADMALAVRLGEIEISPCGNNVYMHGRVRYPV